MRSLHINTLTEYDGTVALDYCCNWPAFVQQLSCCRTTVVGSYCGYSPQTDLTDFGLDLTSWALVLALAFEPGPPRKHAGCKQHSTFCLPPLHTTGAW